MATPIFFDAKLCLDEDSEYCPVRATLALLGQKWVPRIVYELMNGKRRFNELACAVGGWDAGGCGAARIVKGAAATTLYGQLGFSTINRRAAYYRGSRDALVMRRTLRAVSDV